jgi:hypothetical protein
VAPKGNVTRNLRYDITATFTTYKNKNCKLNEGQTYFEIDSRNQVGHPVRAFYGYKIIGFFNSADDVLKSPVQMRPHWQV